MTNFIRHSIGYYENFYEPFFYSILICKKIKPEKNTSYRQVNLYRGGNTIIVSYTR